MSDEYDEIPVSQLIVGDLVEAVRTRAGSGWHVNSSFPAVVTKQDSFGVTLQRPNQTRFSLPNIDVVRVRKLVMLGSLQVGDVVENCRLSSGDVWDMASHFYPATVKAVGNVVVLTTPHGDMMWMPHTLCRVRKQNLLSLNVHAHGLLVGDQITAVTLVSTVPANQMVTQISSAGIHCDDQATANYSMSTIVMFTIKRRGWQRLEVSRDEVLPGDVVVGYLPSANKWVTGIYWIIEKTTPGDGWFHGLAVKSGGVEPLKVGVCNTYRVLRACSQSEPKDDKFPHTCEYCGQKCYFGFNRVEHAVATSCTAA